MADCKSITGFNRCFRCCNATAMIYLTATLSTLVLLNIITASSRLNTIWTLSKALNEAVSKLNMESSEIHNKSTEGNPNLKITISVRRGPSTSKQLLTTKEVKIMEKKGNTAKEKPSNKERPLNCTSCFPHNYSYILDNEDICKPTDTSQTVDIIVLICTIHSNRERRKALRETWLTQTKKNEGSIRYVFLLGMTSNKKLQVDLETESATHRDIVQEDFIDSYNNLTLKTIMGFKWASIKCKNAKFVMKTDDDMFVSLPALKLALKKYDSVLQRSIGGNCRLNEGPIRQKGYKWYVPKEMYPQSKYPGFCSGTGYVTSMTVVQKVYDVSRHVPFFYLEDVYVGLCIHRLGMKFTQIPGFNAVRIPLGCNYKNSIIITSHQLDPRSLREVWNLKCNDTIF
ncbi:beta-1,3-galactosyltransferase 1-like [Saccostrea echinata]|uniref:beta-1,3-galactosyltransferase 1-like n=1 Tax=Saccostrea echinata TaxID=191078 RepID=UPI002A804696|nr:beta-1,3-galactosyltransferase 1-like [Saccostrea echinata]